MIPQDVLITSSKTEVLRFNKQNPIPFSISGNHEIRDTSIKSFWLPQLTNYDNTEKGIFEQSILIESTLNQPITLITFSIGYINDTNGAGILGEIPIKIGDNIPVDPKRISLIPDKLPNTDNIHPQRVVLQIPELRCPVQGFLLYVGCDVAPTSGEISIQVCRRY
ncbi:MAG TPA: hypothetical protein VLS94_08960 [Fusibacter sp.]|nr:hypothetical protein [Fusibacter sp.]